MNQDTVIQELKFKAVRSSGAGGQHVNKVSTKVVLSLNLRKSKAFSEVERERIFKKLAKRLTKDYKLIVECDDTRSQSRNKEIATRRLLRLLKDAIKVPKKRKKTRPGKSAIEKRLSAKQKVSAKKATRQKPDLE